MTTGHESRQADNQNPTRVVVERKVLVPEDGEFERFEAVAHRLVMRRGFDFGGIEPASGVKYGHFGRHLGEAKSQTDD